MTLPKIVGPYSLFQSAGDFVYFSGQIGINPDTGVLVEGIEAQTHQVCANIQSIAHEAGVEISDICKTMIFLTDMADYARVNEIYAEYFSYAPARSCVAVSELPAGASIEIEVIAYKR